MRDVLRAIRARLSDGFASWRAPSTPAHEPVADDPRHVYPELRLVEANPDGLDARAVQHATHDAAQTWYCQTCGNAVSRPRITDMGLGPCRRCTGWMWATFPPNARVLGGWWANP